MPEKRFEHLTFFGSYLDVAELIPDQAEQNAFLLGLLRYYFYGEEPDLPQMAKLAWAGVKPNIDASLRKAMSGRNGGKKPKAESKQPVSTTKAERKQVEVEERIENIDNGIDNDSGEEGHSSNTAPLLAEVLSYCQSIGYTKGRKFFDVNEKKGWECLKYGTWQESVDYWQATENDQPAVKQPKPVKQPEPKPETLDFLKDCTF